MKIVVAALLDAVLSPIDNYAIEIAGPEQFRLDDLIRRQFPARRDGRTVIAHASFTYFRSNLTPRSLLPGRAAKIGVSRFDDGLHPLPGSQMHRNSTGFLAQR